MAATPTIKEIVEYGLEKVPIDASIEISMRDLLFVHQALGELIRFFHQASHYPTLTAIHAFLGDAKSGGGYEVLKEAYYTKLNVLTPEVLEQLYDGKFTHPESPSYISNKARDV